jgi:hypothetical protein
MRSHLLVLMAFSAGTIFSCPVQAQSTGVETPELLSDAALQVDTGMALARRQIGDADLMGATGTLERVLFAHPDAPEPRLLYASLLCRLDDSEGASVELLLIRPDAIAEDAWREVTDACGPVPRPTMTAPDRGSQP